VDIKILQRYYPQILDSTSLYSRDLNTLSTRFLYWNLKEWMHALGLASIATCSYIYFACIYTEVDKGNPASVLLRLSLNSLSISHYNALARKFKKGMRGYSALIFISNQWDKRNMRSNDRDIYIFTRIEEWSTWEWILYFAWNGKLITAIFFIYYAHISDFTNSFFEFHL